MSKNYTLELPTDTTIVMERTFDAPPELVFRAYTDPELIAQWWGYRTAKTVIDKNELTPGGEWRWVQVMPDGSEHGFRGHYVTVDPPKLLVSTFEYEGIPGHIAENTAVFADVGGKTRLTATTAFANKEDRDGMVASGMEGGAAEGWDRLAALLASLA